MVDKLILINYDFNGNSIKNVALEVLAAAPTMIAGRVYFDSTLKKVGYCDGNEWHYTDNYAAGNGIDADKLAAGEISVKNALTDSEKAWIEDQLFAKLFTGSIVASPNATIFAGADVVVTFTLSTKYDGEAVDLDEVPAGWSHTATGVYTKNATITSATGASISSGGVTAKYNGRTKSIGAASASNTKYSYILMSSKQFLTAEDLDLIDVEGVKMSTTNNIKGDKTFEVETAGSYIYFVVANTSTLADVQQMGLAFLQNKTGVELTRTNYGTYKVYRSANAMGVGEQTVTVL